MLMSLQSAAMVLTNVSHIIPFLAPAGLDFRFVTSNVYTNVFSMKETTLLISDLYCKDKLVLSA